jgi:hypothetical protein
MSKAVWSGLNVPGENLPVVRMDCSRMPNALKSWSCGRRRVDRDFSE